MKTTWYGLYVVCLVLGPGSAAARAQPARVELSGFGGASFGVFAVTEPFVEGLQLAGLRNIQVDEGLPLKWAVGGGVGVAAGPQFIVTGDYLVNRIAAPSITATSGRQQVALTMRTTLSEFTGGAQYLFSRTGRGLYVAGGMGIVRLSVSAESAALPAQVGDGTSDLTVNWGGGVRVFGGQRWGFRPDLRVVHVPDDTYVRVTVSLFYQMR